MTVLVAEPSFQAFRKLDLAVSSTYSISV
jgi:hypothetical protein